MFRTSVFLRAAFAAGALLSLASCMTTRNSLFVDADARFAARDYAGGAKALDGPASDEIYRSKDQVLRYLDTGMLYHMAGQPEESSERLSEAERLIEDNYTKSVTNAAASFLVNDYQLEYFGEAYEDLYLNVFKSIDYIRRDQFDGAFVEIRRVGNKLNLLEDKYGQLASSMNSSKEAKGKVKAAKTEFHNSALARYLSMLLYRADGQIDNAGIDQKKLKEAFDAQPHVYPFACPPVDDYLKPTAKARLDVIGFTGRSPLKKANTLRLATADNFVLIALQTEDDKGNIVTRDLEGIPFPGINSGYYFKCQLPEMVLRPSAVSRVSVVVDGVPAGELSLIERMDTVALETFKLSQTPIFFKTVIRTVTKGLLAAKAKEQANKAAANAGGAAMIFALAGGLAADVAVDVSEQADLRSARYFPGQAYVGEFLVEPGEHDVAVEYFSSSGALLYREVFPRRSYGTRGLNVIPSYNLQ